MRNLQRIANNLPSIFTDDKGVTMVKYKNEWRYLINHSSSYMRARGGEFWLHEIKFSYVSLETEEIDPSISKYDSTSS